MDCGHQYFKNDDLISTKKKALVTKLLWSIMRAYSPAALGTRLARLSLPDGITRPDIIGGTRGAGKRSSALVVLAPAARSSMRGMNPARCAALAPGHPGALGQRQLGWELQRRSCSFRGALKSGDTGMGSDSRMARNSRCSG
jgi:hypothetical protein